MAGLTKGFVYAATGPRYTTLARRSARNLRQAHPNALIDLFTDQPVDDPVFSKVHRLNDGWFRPKMDALLHSRFDVSVLLDADTIPLARIDELFEAVRFCDLAASMSTGRPTAMYVDQPEIPRSFPYVNAGVLVVRRNLRTQMLIREWQDIVRRHDLSKDQPSLRWLLFHRRIRFHVLPQEYNLVNLDLLDRWEAHFGAPRLLHVQALHQNEPGDPALPFDPEQVLGSERFAVVRRRQRRELIRLDEMRAHPQAVTGTPSRWITRCRFLVAGLRTVLPAQLKALLRRLR